MKETNIQLSPELSISRIVHGHWRLVDWKITPQELLRLTHQALEMGVDTFDHADIYGNYACEAIFGQALALEPGLRNRINLVTKCGIKLRSDKFPERKIKTYDYSYGHIIASVENSLRNFNTDRLDLLLLHRPSPLLNPEEVARAFSDLKQSGKVVGFGVSNFTPLQFDALQAYVEEPLLTNQVEISPLHLEHFENGNLDHLLRYRIRPMAWSPMARGRLGAPDDERSRRVHQALSEIAAEMNLTVDTVIYAWLLAHPAGIIPIVGSSKPERLKMAADALRISLSSEQWFRIWIASAGRDLP